MTRLLGATLAGAAAFLLIAHLSGHGHDLGLRLSAKRPRRGPSRGVWLRQAGVAVTPAQFRVASAGLGLTVLVVAWGLTASFFVAAVPAVLATRLPGAYFARRRDKRLGELVAAWPDGIRHIVANARAQGTVHRAIVELARSGPESLAEAFARYPGLARTAGPVRALEEIREDIADPTSDRVIEVLIVACEQGQVLALTILRDLAAMVTEDLKALDEIETAGLEPKINARIAFTIPWIVLVTLCLQAGPFREFYRSAGGALVVIVGAAMSLGGMSILRRLARQPMERRVLGAAAGAGAGA